MDSNSNNMPVTVVIVCLKRLKLHKFLTSLLGESCG